LESLQKKMLLLIKKNANWKFENRLVEKRVLMKTGMFGVSMFSISNV